MTFQFPWFLLGLVAVAAAAAWALFRPGRNVVVVSSLSLWRQALEALGRSARRRARRVTLAWLLLLAGALAAVLAAAGPEYRGRTSYRRLAVAVVASAELAGEGGPAALREAIGGLFDRLGADDKVQLVLPAPLGGPTGWLSLAEAREKLRRIEPLAAPAGDIRLPEADAAASHTYVFAPAGAGLAGGAEVSVVELPTSLPPVTIDAMGATLLPGGRAAIFVALRNQTGEARQVRLTIGLMEAGGVALQERVSIGPGQRLSLSRQTDSDAGIFAIVEPEGGQPAGFGGEANLARRTIEVRKVLLAGRDEPLLRRFVAVHPGLAATGDEREADIVIANGVDPPAGKAALVIDPPTSPPGWRRGELREAIVLEKLSIAPDPIMAGVELAGVAIRRVRPWGPVAASWQGALARDEAGAFILKGDESERARRVYVAFDFAEPNTNFGTVVPDFVIFLANVVEYLAPGSISEVSFVSHTPLQADPSWQPVGPSDSQPKGTLLRPGIYRDAAGQLHAVSLTGLRAGRPSVPPAQAVANLPLGEPQYADKPVQLWPVLAAAAGACWLLGWAARMR